MVILHKAQNDLEEPAIGRSNDERSEMDSPWFVYVIECRTNELYVGIAKDVGQRVDLHNKGRACRYTKFRRPVVLRYAEICADYCTARKRERQVKKYSREKKLALAKKT